MKNSIVSIAIDPAFTIDKFFASMISFATIHWISKSEWMLQSRTRSCSCLHGCSVG